MSLITVFRMPTVKGHQSDGNKLPFLEVFKNSELVLLMDLHLLFILPWVFIILSFRFTIKTWVAP